MGATALTLTPPGAEWIDRIICRPYWALMDGETPKDERHAKELCHACPVEKECRSYALSLPPAKDVYGVAGGMTAKERELLRRRIRRAKAPELPRACTRCGEVQPAEAFYRRPTYPSGRESQCRTCCMARNRISKAAKRAAAKQAKEAASCS